MMKKIIDIMEKMTIALAVNNNKSELYFNRSKFDIFQNVELIYDGVGLSLGFKTEGGVIFLPFMVYFPVEVEYDWDEVRFVSLERYEYTCTCLNVIFEGRFIDALRYLIDRKKFLGID